MNTTSLLIPGIIYLTLLVFGFPYIKKKSKIYSINTGPWYVLLVFMPLIVLPFFYFSQVRPKES
jgi:hypothetical protein